MERVQLVRTVSACAQSRCHLNTKKPQQKGHYWGELTQIAPVGTVIAKEEDRTRRVDKGKSGQALKTAVSGGFGGGILSQI